MSGTLWALAAGVGFGLFQALNLRALHRMDVYLSTFLQIVVSAVVLAGIAAVTEDLNLVWTASWPALLNFSAGAFVHIFLGWTFLNASQKRIGAARTSPLLSTVPLFGTIFAAAALRELPGPVELIGVVVVVAGLFYLTAEEGVAPDGAAQAGSGAARPGMGWRGSSFGLGAALCWATSPIFIRQGLRDLPSPLLGLTVGLVPCVVAYGVGMLFRRNERAEPASPDALVFKVVAGVLVGLSQWARWVALELAPVGVVLALTQVSVPMVIFLSPMVAGRHLERVTARVWGGAAVIVSGSLLLIWSA